MPNHYDIAYGLGVGVSAPFWLLRPAARRKVFAAFRQRMGRVEARAGAAGPAIMIHAVSLGEVNATRSLVQSLRQARPGAHFIISTTTETGHQQAARLYGQAADATVIRYPLDFSGAVKRVLDVLKPDVVVLMELEVWPNFLRQCRKRGIPVVLVNGRLTSGSYSRYKWIKPVAAGMFRKLAAICVQDENYAARFIDLGADPASVSVTGTMKFDTAQVADHVDGDDRLATDLGLFPGAEPIWVCGSTGPGEERLILEAYSQLLRRHSRLRLALVPRKPERFDEVAALIEEARFRCVRRSRTGGATVTLAPLSGEGVLPPVVLGDTMGELRKFYSLADVALVGRSLVDLGSRQHGSDMIEPAALGRPVVTGPYTGNFAEAMSALRRADAVMEVVDGPTLQQTLSVLLSSPAEALAMGRRAQRVVVEGKGATDRHARVILEQLDRVPAPG